MIGNDLLQKAYYHMCLVKHMAAIYEQHRAVCKYVHSTSRGHEAVQLALAYLLDPADFVSPYYRDESLLLGLGFQPYELMLQLLAKSDDPFTGGRSYYAHPSYRGSSKPTIIQQSSATGMQVIPTTGIAQGIQYIETYLPQQLSKTSQEQLPVIVCSLGDASITEGEVSEAFQVAVLKKLPILYLVQDNGWGISVAAEESRAMDACSYAAGFPGLTCLRIDGSDFEASYAALATVIERIRKERVPFLVQANLPLLGHHTSGVRKEFYRTNDDIAAHALKDPQVRLLNRLKELGFAANQLESIDQKAQELVEQAFKEAMDAAEPSPSTITDHIFAPTPILQETGNRQPVEAASVNMVDAALLAIREIMAEHPEVVLYGQDVGRRLGGVFREAATLAEQFGDHRVFNTAIQEAYIIGSTAGMCAAGLKPIVEVQFADYIYPALNQLVSEIAKSCYLSQGKFPIQTLIRVPTGAYGGGGPYHSGSIESTLLSIKGIKVVYPSNAADMKGLLKAAFYDPNPVVLLEHKGLYWSKVAGTAAAKCNEPSADYIIPLGKANRVLAAEQQAVDKGDSCCIITYGMGVYWAKSAATDFPGKIDIIDLRCLFPLDEELIMETVKKHGRCVVVTEEQQHNSFAEALAGRIAHQCFQWLDAPIAVLGALNLPAVPLNSTLETAMLPNADKLKKLLERILSD